MIVYWLVVAIYAIGLASLIAGILDTDALEKARCYAYAASMFGAAGCVGTLRLLRRTDRSVSGR